MASKRSQNLIKNELETKSTKHVENVLNEIRSHLQETRFRMEGLPKITKTGQIRTNIKKWSRKEAKIHETSVSELNKKPCLKTELNKTKKSQNNNPKWLQQK